MIKSELESMKVAELKKYIEENFNYDCKNMKKAELIEFILEHQEEVVEEQVEEVIESDVEEQIETQEAVEEIVESPIKETSNTDIVNLVLNKPQMLYADDELHTPICNIAGLVNVIECSGICYHVTANIPGRGLIEGFIVK